MTTLNVGKSLNDQDALWRYMSLDKFIDLVESQSLFFVPLSWYEKTDPFEGYVPQVAFQALADISKKYRDQHLAQLDKLEGASTLSMPPPIKQRLRHDLLKLREKVESQVPTMGALAKNIADCTVVNCWYRSTHESEGMWNLYARNGVAIRTSVGALRAALEDGEEVPVVHLGAVKYLDFADTNLTASDCVTVDGQMIGMIKRVAYEHEKEVRMYIAPTRPEDSVELYKPEAKRVSLNVHSLIESVVISPFASATIDRSARAVCRWSGVDESFVSRSKLLDRCTHLLDVFS
ncbi:DUF2971 domain-containing protein [Paraburkholderia tropica]|uniref:DUF2971 domain-containing protein n=1 Tax=Paraburkholderia tropica TaxID=92647 RepID=UPI002AB05CB4|nr:DUF2971 domain-containing protein [Paraburkholderia tropica]